MAAAPRSPRSAPPSTAVATAFDRRRAIDRLGGETFDVVVVGGGITGVGVALDAASRGLRTALIERDDLSSGTSSRSSKLIHGGLRYLQQGDVRLVYQALRERQLLRRNAPHLVKVLPFLIPIFGRDGIIHPKVARALGTAMWGYDLTGGARIGKVHKRLTAQESIPYMDTLPVDRLAASYLYYDAQADDSRLVLAIARTAAIDHDAVIANRVACTGIDKGHDGKVVAVRAHTVEGRELTIRASAVVNAAGVWADDVRALDEGTHPDTIRPAKGIHITVPWDLVRNTIAAVIPVPGDKRSVFVVPWGDHTYIGTTDTDYDGDVDDPQCTPEDIEYLLRAINKAVTTTITAADVTGTWAGLRPLVKSASSGRTADLSRRHKVTPSGSGVVSITGGKLTTYREMAADAVDEIVAELLARKIFHGGRRAMRSHTAKLRLRGAAGYPALARELGGTDPVGSAPSDLDAPTRARHHLLDRFGDEVGLIDSLVAADPSLGEPLVPELPYLRAEAIAAVRYEMAVTLDDVLSRRTRARLLDRVATGAAARDVAELIAPELGWDGDEVDRQVADLQVSLAAEADPLEALLA